MIYSVIDLETTGSDVNRDAVVEVGIVRLNQGQIDGEFLELVQPRIPITLGAERTHGISTAEARAKGHPPHPVLQRMLAFIGESVLVAHNGLRFDFPLLRAELSRYGIPVPSIKLLDTLPLARKVLQTKRGEGKLADLCRAHNISLENAHRAINDARATAALFKIIATKEPELSTLWAHCGQIDWTAVGIDPNIFEIIERAMLSGLDLYVEYHGMNKPASERWLKPRHFDPKVPGAAMMIAHCYVDDIDKQFVVSRVRRIIQIGR